MQLTSKEKECFFKDAFELHFERVVVYICGYCKDWEMARNIAQDTFVVFWENIDKVDSSKTALPYLFFVARNRTINAMKRDIVGERYRTYTQKKEMEVGCMALESSTMNAVYVAEMNGLISKSVEQMNEKVRETFCLSRFKSMNNEQVAIKLNVSVKTVEYRMATALRILRKNLSDFIEILIILYIFILK